MPDDKMAIVSAYILKTAMHWIISAYIFFA